MRLTEKDEQGNWSLKGVKWEQLQVGKPVTQELWEQLYGALWKLMEYEDTGSTPEEVVGMQDFKLSHVMKYRGEVARNRWIPVADRLPEEGGNYLVTMVTPGYLSGQPYTNWLYWDGADCDWLTDEAGDSVPEQETEVIAWKPIPEPYKPDLRQ